MTTMELRADIFENLNFLLDNEEANGTALVNMTLTN